MKGRGRNNGDLDFKTIVHKPTILSWILHECVDEFKDSSIDEIKTGLVLANDGKQVIGRDTELFLQGVGKVRLDSVFDIGVPGTDEKVSVIIGIEGQNDIPSDYPVSKRAEYYLAMMVASQKGRDFSNQHYEKIRKTYTIWCMMDPLSGNRNTIIKYGMVPKTIIGKPEAVADLDTMNAIFINLGGSYSDRCPSKMKFISTLFSSGISEERRKEIIVNKFKVPLDEYPDEELRNMGFIEEDSRRRYTREATVDHVKCLMAKLDISAEDALDLLDVSDSERPSVMRKVKTPDSE